jgi:acyl phosphate:glycerol-3-phosphate acyltransferase
VKILLIIVVGYLLGSIPFGYLIVRFKQGGDIREVGSGGTGATNVSRGAGKAAGIVTLILDALKGAAAILVTRRLLMVLGQDDVAVDSAIAVAAIAVIVGHIFPVWLRFKGGKGVATAVGVFLVLAPLAMIWGGVVFFAVVFSTRYVSLGSILSAATIPICVWWIYGTSTWVVTAATVVALLVVFAHRENIGRIVNGTESKFR